MSMSLTEMIGNMGVVAWIVMISLAICSLYSLAVMIDRFTNFARPGSSPSSSSGAREVPEGEPAREGRRDLAAVQEVAHREGRVGGPHGGPEPGRRADHSVRPGRSRAALARHVERPDAAEMKKGLGGLATIGSTAPFIGLFGTVFGIINAFTGMAATGSGGLAAVSAGIAEALITTATGLAVAIPAVMAFNYFTGQLERFQIEMTNSSAELIDYFLKRREAHAGR